MPAAKKAAAKKTAAPQARKRAATGRPTKKAPAPPKKGVETAATSMTMVRVGKFDYPLISSSKCHTCQNPHRRWIENEILLGRSYSSIVERLADMPTGPRDHPSTESLRAHVQSGHTPTPAKIRRQIIDRRAQEIGAKIVGDDSVVDHITLNALMIQRASELLASGEIEMSAADINATIAMRLKIEETSKDGYDSEVMEAALFAQMDTTMKMLPPERVQEYARAVESHPVLRAVMKRVREANTIDVEVVEEKIIR